MRDEKAISRHVIKVEWRDVADGSDEKREREESKLTPNFMGLN